MNASVDIGTNTVLLLVAEHHNGNVEVLREEQRIPRLGRGVDDAKHLSQDAMQRVVDVLEEYQQIVRQEYPAVEHITVTATSAVRDAQNRDKFLHLVEQETGLKIQVLSGLEEAQYTFLGAQSVIEDSGGQKVIIDIGGGSTEIASGRGGSLGDRYSYNMGCVRFTERFLKDDPPAESQLDACRKAVQRTLEEYEFNFTGSATLIGVAGTVTSLAFIEKELEAYSSEALAGYQMTGEMVTGCIQKFKGWPSQKLAETYPAVMEGRADIFLAGLLILEGFMKKYHFKDLIVSTGGIRHGAIMMAKK